MGNSKEILKELVRLEAVETLNDDEDKELGDTKDENCEYNHEISFLADLVW